MKTDNGLSSFTCHGSKTCKRLKAFEVNVLHRMKGKENVKMGCERKARNTQRKEWTTKGKNLNRDKIGAQASMRMERTQNGFCLKEEKEDVSVVVTRV